MEEVLKELREIKQLLQVIATNPEQSISVEVDEKKMFEALNRVTKEQASSYR